MYLRFGSRFFHAIFRIWWSNMWKSIWNIYCNLGVRMIFLSAGEHNDLYSFLFTWVYICIPKLRQIFTDFWFARRACQWMAAVLLLKKMIVPLWLALMYNQRFSQLHSLLSLVKALPSKIWMMHPAAGASAWHTQLAHVRCSLFVPVGFDARNPRCVL